jgi:hypothetical protein
MPTQAPSGKFYDASINGGFNCRDGVGGTDGGPYGTVKVDTSTDTAEIRVSRLSPNTAYEVFLNVTGPGGCGEQHLTTRRRTGGEGLSFSVHLLLPPGQRRLLPQHRQCAGLRNSVHNVLALPRRICRGSGIGRLLLWTRSGGSTMCQRHLIRARPDARYSQSCLPH